MAEERERDEEEYEDDEEVENGDGGGDEGLVESLVSQIREHRELIAPVATTAAAAAATYAAKKLPDLISQIEGASGDSIREKLGEASNAGGMKGFAAGAASRALSTGGGGGLMERLKQGGEQEAQEEAEESGGVKGAMAKLAGKMKSGGKGGFGWGKGRRLPILVHADVPAPVKTVYDQWTQFEELNEFMHRVESVEQEEPETVVWHENIWGRRRQWKAQIVEQVPNERIAWELKSGNQGKGVITFHELAPNLTRVEVVFDWQPQGMVEKMASGMRFHKRAARTDLHRFKAFVATRGEASGGWRGRIEDGEAKGQTRNRRNRDADPVPTEAQQHTESDERNLREKEDGDGDGAEQETSDAARAERKRHRDERSKGRTSGTSRRTSGTGRGTSGTSRRTSGTRRTSRTKEES